jgi:hypothetical protein
VGNNLDVARNVVENVIYSLDYYSFADGADGTDGTDGDVGLIVVGENGCRGGCVGKVLRIRFDILLVDFVDDIVESGCIH